MEVVGFQARDINFGKDRKCKEEKGLKKNEGGDCGAEEEGRG